MNRKILICITGSDGSGKSTLLAHLHKQLAQSRIVSIWDAFYSPKHGAAMPFSSPEEVARYLAILKPESRSLFLMHCMNEALSIAMESPSKYLLLDGYWYKYYATERSHGAPASILNPIINHFPEPDHLFFLELDTALAASRKQHFSAYECGYAQRTDEQSFKDFQEKSLKVLGYLLMNKAHQKLSGLESTEHNSKIIQDTLYQSL